MQTPFHFVRRAFLQSLTCGFVLHSRAVWAQPFGGQTLLGRPGRFVINASPGGPLDIFGRALALGLERDFKENFVLMNAPGAGGNIGADVVARSEANGRTILLSIDSPFTINPHLPGATFSTASLRPLMIFCSSSLTFAIEAALGVTTLSDFVAQAKETNFAFCSGGNGSPGHLASAIFASVTGAAVTHVPYKGNAPAALALARREVQAGILGTAGLLPYLHLGEVVPLATTGSRRSPLLPNVPTVGELGYPEMEFSVYYQAMVPVAPSEAVMTELRSSLAAVLSSQPLRDVLSSLDMAPLGETGQVAVERLNASSARYAKLIRTAGLKLD